MRLLVTGATGFIGCYVLNRFAGEPTWQLRGAARHQPIALASAVEKVLVDELAPDTDWLHALAGMDVVVHTAARAHVLQELATEPLAEYRRVNVAGTLNLARQAAAAGVRRFIFISSVKVNGESTLPGQPFKLDDEPAPVDPYGISKNEAEQGLRHLAQETGIEVVIIRPPIVYGPGVKANFLTLMRWLQKGIPLPLGAVHNQRSFVALDNLVGLIRTCLQHPAATNQTFFASDEEDLSTTSLLKRLAAAMGKPARLLPVPVQILQTSARLAGKTDQMHKLCGSLQVDMSKTREMLGWTPPMSVEEALRLTAEHFLAGPSNA